MRRVYGQWYYTMVGGTNHFCMGEKQKPQVRNRYKFYGGTSQNSKESTFQEVL